MKYEEAKKRLVPAKNMYRIKLGWDTELIVPYEDGTALLKLLEKAEKIASIHDKEKVKVTPFDLSESVSAYPISEEVVRNIKIAQLMGITYKELENELNTRPTSST